MEKLIAKNEAVVQHIEAIVEQTVIEFILNGVNSVYIDNLIVLKAIGLTSIEVANLLRSEWDRQQPYLTK